MSYLTSHFITLAESRSLQAKSSRTFCQLENSSRKTTKPSSLYRLKTNKQHQLKTFGKQTKTKPLILFVNLLMKNGKKSHALQVLSTTLSLFKARVSKMKLDKYVGSLKQSSQSFCRYFFRSFIVPGSFNSVNSTRAGKQTTLPAFRTSSYNIGPNCFYLIFSRKKKTKWSTLHSVSSGYNFSLLKYKPLYPFIGCFLDLFFDFYFKKKGFCGKFLHLRPRKINQTHLHFLPLFGKFQCISNMVSRKELSRNWQNLKIWQSGVKQSKPLVSLEKKNTLLDFNKCLWYKALAKKPSWEKASSAEKNSFLYCIFKAISNVKPPLECRTKRIGGSNKQIPSQVAQHRQWRIAIGWIIEAAQNEFSKKKNQNTLQPCLYKTDFSNTLETLENFRDKSEIVRGMLYKKLLWKTNKGSLALEITNLKKLSASFNSGSSETEAKKNPKQKQKGISSKAEKVKKGPGLIQLTSPSQPQEPYKAQRIVAYPGEIFSSIESNARDNAGTFAKGMRKPMHNRPNYLESWVIEQKTSCISSQFRKSPKIGRLNFHFKKTKFKKINRFCFFLAESLENAYYKKGPAMQKRNLWIEAALTNRAFLRYRWW